MSIKKLCLAGVLVALGVALSAVIVIPVGASKVFPIQHFINVLAGVLLGPLYAVGMAFATSVLRVMLGTGTLLAFPGSMCGALLCGLLYKYTKKISVSFIGEVIGTGVIGAVIAYPVATFLLSREVAFFFYVIPFTLSAFVGATLSILLITALKDIGVFKYLVD